MIEELKTIGSFIAGQNPVVTIVCFVYLVER